MASPIPTSFVAKVDVIKVSATDSQMSPAEWISLHNFAGLSPWSVTARNLSPSAFQ